MVEKNRVVKNLTFHGKVDAQMYFNFRVGMITVNKMKLQ